MASLGGSYREGRTAGCPSLEVECGEWQGYPWRHRAVLVGGEPRCSGTCLLYLTGGDPHPTDLAWVSAVSARSGLPVVACFDVPNQPLFERSEDWLIAYTFDRFLETGEEDWPLLNQMVKGALTVADAARAAWGCESWIPCGASKRGWTAWLAAIEMGDRAKGVVPMAFDHLAMQCQVDRQTELWGAPSPMYEPYVEFDLLRRTRSEAGEALLDMVDPALRLRALRCPVHLVSGANDPFWLVDASNAYWGDLPTRAGSLFMPNTGHVLPSSPVAVGSTARFAAACAAGRPFPTIWWEEGGRHVVGTEGLEGGGWLWTAESETYHFVEARWKPQFVTDLGKLPAIERNAPYTGVIVEAWLDGDDGPASVSSRPVVLRA